MENIVDPVHRILDALDVSDVADIVLYLFVVVFVTHIVLFLLVTTEYPYLFDVGIQKSLQYRVAETSGSAGDQQSFAFKHSFFSLFVNKIF